MIHINGVICSHCLLFTPTPPHPVKCMQGGTLETQM